MTFDCGKIYRFVGSLMDAPSFYRQKTASRTLNFGEVFILLKPYKEMKANRGWIQVLIFTESGEIGTVWINKEETLYEELLK